MDEQCSLERLRASDFYVSTIFGTANPKSAHGSKTPKLVRFPTGRYPNIVQGRRQSWKHRKFRETGEIQIAPSRSIQVLDTQLRDCKTWPPNYAKLCSNYVHRRNAEIAILQRWASLGKDRQKQGGYRGSNIRLLSLCGWRIPETGIESWTARQRALVCSAGYPAKHY
jgi:hypothetical protein